MIYERALTALCFTCVGLKEYEGTMRHIAFDCSSSQFLFVWVVVLLFCLIKARYLLFHPSFYLLIFINIWGVFGALARPEAGAV